MSGICLTRSKEVQKNSMPKLAKNRNDSLQKVRMNPSRKELYKIGEVQLLSRSKTSKDHRNFRRTDRAPFFKSEDRGATAKGFKKKGLIKVLSVRWHRKSAEKSAVQGTSGTGIGTSRKMNGLITQEDE